MVDLRKLKDQATRALEKRSYDKAAELYLQIAEVEPHDPDWRQRAGEAYRKAGRSDDAIKQLVFAAAGYARAGFLLKAIAVCKVVLQIDPRHANMQGKLADLYAQREGAPSSAIQLARTPSGNFEMVSVAAPPLAVQSPASFIAGEPLGTGSPQLFTNTAPMGGALTTLDEIIPHGSPLDAVPLATVLDGRRSEQFDLVASEDLPDGAAADATAYEIDLTIEDDEEEEPTGPPRIDLANPKLAPSLLDLATLTPTPMPAPAAPAPAPLARLDDELDFSTLIDAAPAPALPKIPLLSSLGPDRLLRVIDRCSARSFEAGDEILHEGERGGALFVIVTGRVRVVVAGPIEREVAVLGDGEFFGELGLLTDFPRSATVVAEAPTEVLEFSRELFSEVVADSPEVLRTLLRFFRDRLLDRLLGSSELFQRFEPEDARQLAERFIFLELEPKLRVIHEGKRAPGLFLILCGEVQVAQNGESLASLGPGDVFGEMSLLDGRPAMASIDTLTKCWALELERAKFQEIVLSYPQVLEYVSELAERRRAANQARESRVDYL